MPRHKALDHFCIARCPASRRREALLRLAAVRDPTEQSTLNAALQRAKTVGEVAWQGLWVASRGEHIVSALWVESLTATTARLWLPEALDAAARALLDGVRPWLATSAVRLCHFALDPGQGERASFLAASGLEPIATLWHLRATLAPPAPSSALALAPFGALAPARQEALVSALAEGSLDCPAILDTLPVEALLAGFYAQAPEAPRHWYQILHEGEAVGALLLAPRSSAEWELQLMGLVPAWRGRRLGHALVREAQRLALEGRATTLALTVDAANAPACRAYARAGFEVEREQQLRAWRLPGTQDRQGADF
ncbi:GNAT family N-acetyltransferase [Vreelandella malpeensis]|uniref:GNAT family N-acetyltransferase n=1 Tax=Vreelandella malpeensis TaxID=1172368 RepID=A0ABS8DWG5_9GAMM|nr:GNAT family N-acetyltransferase [Halomonas malpeensis]MCB8890584.1 GNAT family N-acetyltransferase [Halomonas malpeensis]